MVRWTWFAFHSLCASGQMREDTKQHVLWLEAAVCDDQFGTHRLEITRGEPRKIVQLWSIAKYPEMLGSHTGITLITSFPWILISTTDPINWFHCFHLQPFLCAVFAPKCERLKNRDMVYLPSLEMCRITMEPCRILYNTSFFPEFLKCSESIFPSKCNNDVREMKFNAMGQCLPPLVPSDSSSNYYKGNWRSSVQHSNESLF